MLKRMMLSLGMMACMLGAGCSWAAWDHVTSTIVNSTLIAGGVAAAVAAPNLIQAIQGLLGGG